MIQQFWSHLQNDGNNITSSNSDSSRMSGSNIASSAPVQPPGAPPDGPPKRAPGFRAIETSMKQLAATRVVLDKQLQGIEEKYSMRLVLAAEQTWIKLERILVDLRNEFLRIKDPKDKQSVEQVYLEFIKLEKKARNKWNRFKNPGVYGHDEDADDDLPLPKSTVSSSTAAASGRAAAGAAPPPSQSPPQSSSTAAKSPVSGPQSPSLTLHSALSSHRSMSSSPSPSAHSDSALGPRLTRANSNGSLSYTAEKAAWMRRQIDERNDHNMSSGSQEQQQLLQQEQVYGKSSAQMLMEEDLARERTRLMHQVEQDSVHVTDMYRDVSQMVELQQESIDLIEDSLAVVKEKAEDGGEQLAQAARKSTYGLGLAGAVAGALLGGPVGFVVVGMKTAIGLGVTGAVGGALVGKKLERSMVRNNLNTYKIMKLQQEQLTEEAEERRRFINRSGDRRRTRYRIDDGGGSEMRTILREGKTRTVEEHGNGSSGVLEEKKHDKAEQEDDKDEEEEEEEEEEDEDEDEDDCEVDNEEDTKKDRGRVNYHRPKQQQQQLRPQTHQHYSLSPQYLQRPQQLDDEEEILLHRRQHQEIEEQLRRQRTPQRPPPAKEVPSIWSMLFGASEEGPGPPIKSPPPQGRREDASTSPAMVAATAAAATTTTPPTARVGGSGTEISAERGQGAGRYGGRSDRSHSVSSSSPSPFGTGARTNYGDRKKVAETVYF